MGLLIWTEHLQLTCRISSLAGIVRVEGMAVEATREREEVGGVKALCEDCCVVFCVRKSLTNLHIMYAGLQAKRKETTAH